ncbi:MAG: DUF4835 family protein [Calditrichaeota bacterium]|nr:DUF4835 family protein [Calditrichota bacterium]
MGLIWTIFSSLYAQHLQPVVTLHTDRLPEEEKQYLSGLAGQLERLIRAANWVEKPYNYQFSLKIDIFFEKWTRTALQRRYTAGILVALKDGVQFRDRRWEFPYSQDEPLNFSDPYHPLTGLIEFYNYLALAREIDLLAPLSGDSYGQKAYFISQSSRSEALYALGWDARRELADYLNRDSTITSLRQAAFYARAGYYYLDKNIQTAAEDNLCRAAELLLQVPPQMVELHRDDHIIRFVDIARFAEALKEASLKDILSQFEEWDVENVEIFR